MKKRRYSLDSVPYWTRAEIEFPETGPPDTL